MEEKFTVTARKFRPRTFSEMVGQKHIVRPLGNALEKNRIAHAYLFSGTRGVGKTTTARILAKSLNCEKGPTPEPCLECGNCMEIAAGSSIDVMEIDGASNRGIDNIRELKESVMFAPAKSRYKIYTIDEVHQITKEAFNALLKTLEEPPPFVVFIFATTELSKVPDTILSRCQSFEFKPISLAEIATQLSMIAEREGIKSTPQAINLIARKAKGSMRDAQSMFDQAEAYGGGEVTEDGVKASLGMVDNATLFALMDAVAARDMGVILDVASTVSSGGTDFAAFLEDLAGLVRKIMAARLGAKPGEAEEKQEAERIGQWAEALDYDELQRFFTVITDTMRNARFSSQPHLVMEMGLLRLGEKRGLASLDEAIETVAKIRARAQRDYPQQVFEAPARHEAPDMAESNLAPAEPNIQMAASGTASVISPASLMEEFKNERPILMGVLDQASVRIKGEAVVIVVSDLHSREVLEEKEMKTLLEDISRKRISPAARVVVEYRSEKKNDDQVQANRSEDRKESIRKQMLESPIMEEAMDVFHLEEKGFKLLRRT